MSLKQTRIFISHSSIDGETASEICAFLEKNDVKCFLAPRDIDPGREYAEEIINGIDRADGMVLLMTANANQSPHVLREVERAVSKRIPILVYKMEEVELSKSMEYFLMTHQWADAKTQKDFSEILEFAKSPKRPSAAEEEEPKEASGGDGKKAQKKNRWFLSAAGILLLIGILAAAVLKNSAPVSVKAGDTLTFGSYNGETIAWRVLKVSKDGKEAVLIAKDILTMKAFDAPESGKYNVEGANDYWGQGSPAETDLELQARVRGSSDWSTSNIRTWLNSADEVVAYEGQAPVGTAMSEQKNGYQNEPGFLYGFTEEERSAIIETSVQTKGNALTGENVNSQDKVFLLSREELAWFEEAGISLLARPTEAALRQDNSGWYQIYSLDYGLEEYYWWLRDPVEGTASKCYLVGNGYTEDTLVSNNAGQEGFGIRPAVKVDLQADCFQAK